MQQNALLPIKLVSAGSLVDGLTSPAVHIQWLDNVAIQWNALSGTVSGTFQVQGSLDYSEEPASPGSVLNAGNWINVTLTSVPTLTSGTFPSSATSALSDLTGLSFPWIRITFAPTSAGVIDVLTVADVSKSLASKYFLLNKGNNGAGYYVWYKVSGTGVDPALAGRTGIEVDITTNDTANTIASATSTAVGLVSGFATSVSTNDVTITLAPGPFVPASDVNTTFTITTTTGLGSVDVYVSAKQA